MNPQLLEITFQQAAGCRHIPRTLCEQLSLSITNAWDYGLAHAGFESVIRLIGSQGCVDHMLEIKKQGRQRHYYEGDHFPNLTRQRLRFVPFHCSRGFLLVCGMKEKEKQLLPTVHLGVRIQPARRSQSLVSTQQPRFVLQALKVDATPSERRAAAIYNASRGTLSNQRAGRPSRADSIANSRMRDNNEERVIVEHINGLVARGFPLG